MTAAQVAAQRREKEFADKKKKDGKTNIDKFSKSILEMIEYLVNKGQNRNELYDATVKQLFYFFAQSVKNNNNKMQNEAMSMFISNAAVQAGKSDIFKDYMEKLSNG